MSSGEEALGRGALVASVGTGLSRLTGFVRLGAMTYALGVVESKLADTYALANTTPNIIYELVIGGVLSSVLQRAYVEVRSTQGQEEAFRFIARLARMASIVLAGITVVGIVLAPWVFGLYTGDGASEAEQRKAGALLLRLFIPQILFYGFGTISTAVLNTHRRFGPPMLAPVLNNLIVISTFIAFAAMVPAAERTLSSVPTDGLLLLGIGTTLGVLAQGSVPWLYLRRTGFRWGRKVGFTDPRMRRLAILSAFMVGYVATNQLGLWVALKLANLIQGGVAGYTSAYVFFQLPHGLLAVSVAVVVFTQMTESAVAQDMPSFARGFNRGVRAIWFLVIPAAAGYIAIAPRVIRLLLEHGLATEASTAMIATTLRAWAPGILFFSTFYIVLRAYYALGDTRTPMMINLVAFAVNVSLNLLLFFSMDGPRAKVAGLAVGHAVSYLFAAVIGLVMIRRRTAPELTSGLARTLSLSLIAAAATGAGAFFVSEALAAAIGDVTVLDQLVAVSGGTVTGLLIYAASAKVLGLEEMRWIAQLVSRKR